MSTAQKKTLIPASRDHLSDYRDLLVHVESDEAGEARLDVAVGVAKRFGATLVGVGAATLDPIIYSDPSGMTVFDLVSVARKVIDEDLERAQAMFADRSAGMSSRWLCLDAVPIEAITEHAGEVDLIVAGSAAPEQKDSYKHASTGELILRSGRPVLVVPPRAAPLIADAIVVAWKDTREARRAVSDAMPFLRRAKTVLVVEICSQPDVADAESRTSAVAEHLRRHGVEAASRAVVSAGDPAREIQTTAGAIDADLIVLGAYGHSRLGERIFGGVTRDLLHGPQQYLLMSH